MKDHVPERPVRRRRAEGRGVPVGGVGEDGVAPPGRECRRADLAVLGELKHEEDEDCRDREARVESGGEDV
jgi:hypothetical protein